MYVFILKINGFEKIDLYEWLCRGWFFLKKPLEPNEMWPA